MERDNEKANAPRSSRNSASRKKKEREKRERTYTRRAACRKTSGTKLSTPDKKAHARKTHSPARDKRRARNKTAMRRARVPAPLVPPATLPPGHSITFRKQKTPEKPSEKNKLLSAKNETSFDSRERIREGGGRGTRCRGQGRPGKGQRETKSRQETDSSKLIVSDNSRWHTKKDCAKEISGSSFEKRETTRSGREKKK